MSPEVLQRLLPSLRDICNSKVDCTKQHTIAPPADRFAQLAPHKQLDVTVDVHAERMTDSRGTMEFSVLTVCDV